LEGKHLLAYLNLGLWFVIVAALSADSADGIYSFAF
jgi:hypothetical protein